MSLRNDLQQCAAITRATGYGFGMFNNGRGGGCAMGVIFKVAGQMPSSDNYSRLNWRAQAMVNAMFGAIGESVVRFTKADAIASWNNAQAVLGPDQATETVAAMFDKAAEGVQDPAYLNFKNTLLLTTSKLFTAVAA
jgi:hypothetical protein